MAEWHDLAGELDRWAAAGLTATFWWRDDDAGPDDSRLAGFLTRRRRLDVPLALAVVPDWLVPATTRLIAEDPGSTVLQHGWRHQSHTAPGQRKQELTLLAPPADLDRDLAAGRSALAAAFGARFHAVMVPPWNRIDPKVAGRLAGLGFGGLSTLGARGAPDWQGLALANVHIDIMNWTTQAFVGDAVALDQACGHLAARRRGPADRNEPTGLMTHHRVHDDACDAFVDRFVTMVHDHGAACWLDARAVFPTVLS